MGIIEGEEIKHQEMKEKVEKECTVKAINTWAVLVIRYSAATVDWENSELRNMERKTRKVLNIYQALHPRSNVD